MRALWEWSRAPAQAQTSTVSEIAGMIDGLLTGAFRLRNLPATRSWWTDGVVKLHLQMRSPTSIDTAGAAIWACDGGEFYLAPFECEFHFASPGDPECQRIVVRFGTLDRTGSILRSPYDSRPAESLINSRPTENAKWAFAVEQF